MRATSSGVTNDSVPGPARPYHGAWSKKDYRLVAAVDYDYREDQLENIAAQVNRLAPQIQDDARAVQHTVRAAAPSGEVAPGYAIIKELVAPQQGASHPGSDPCDPQSLRAASKRSASTMAPSFTTTPYGRGAFP